RCVEEALADREFLCADRFTIADICIAYAIHLANSLDIEEVHTPNIAAYWQRMIQRPSYQRAAEL
ncbi:MAG: glutathione binding-like protein, partial [Gammaproteobacteria bacterium]|nr:glutathione binding-like protein [Gammaproteobacteria bacterium]